MQSAPEPSDADGARRVTEAIPAMPSGAFVLFGGCNRAEVLRNLVVCLSRTWTYVARVCQHNSIYL